MQRFICLLFLMGLLMSSYGCFFVHDREGERGEYRDRDEHRDYDRDRDGGNYEERR
jgi:hypothetical protein